jgi:2-amino-4-hydroxy-6-hydroxymethyldihydropteridine diphosphokinase
MARAFLSLGSNLGDRAATLEAALRALEASGDVRILRRSSLYETAPMGKTDQPEFHNLVVEVETTLGPEVLLDRCQDVERALGRVRKERWGPRTVDVDLLLYDRLTVTTERLIIPHPEMLRRRFVLEPLLEIAPGAILPDGTPIASHLAGVEDQRVRRLVRP